MRKSQTNFQKRETGNWFCLHDLVSFYRKFFSGCFSTSKPDSNKPSKKSKKHKPFSEVIINMAMNEQQPLGNFHECNDTKIYDFMNVLTKVITQQEKN